ERGTVELVLRDERRPDQRAVVGVRPGVVRALDRALRVAVRLRVADARAAMPADVVEAAELAVLPADHDDALTGDVDGDEIAGLRGLVGPRDVHPFTEEHPIAVELVDLRRAVIVAG